MRGEPVRTVRQADFFEKGGKPFEIAISRQWYIRNGGKPWTDPASRSNLNKKLVGRGRNLKFHPDFMRIRYENWVIDLNNDRLASRQCFFGVPFLLRYEVDEGGEVGHSKVVIPCEDTFLADLSTDAPAGCSKKRRDKAGGSVGELDIMDI